jgi:hypothetical protein
MPRPHERHQMILAALIAVLWPHITSRKLGRIWPEIEVILPDQAMFMCLICSFLPGINSSIGVKMAESMARLIGSLRFFLRARANVIGHRRCKHIAKQVYDGIGWPTKMI